MLEGSNRSGVTGITANSARDDGAIMSSKPCSGSIANKMPVRGDRVHGSSSLSRKSNQSLSAPRIPVGKMFCEAIDGPGTRQPIPCDRASLTPGFGRQHCGKIKTIRTAAGKPELRRTSERSDHKSPVTTGVTSTLQI